MGNMLNAHDWQSYAGNEVGIWVSVEQQKLLLIDSGRLIKRYR